VAENRVKQRNLVNTGMNLLVLEIGFSSFYIQTTLKTAWTFPLILFLRITEFGNNVKTVVRAKIT